MTKKQEENKIRRVELSENIYWAKVVLLIGSMEDANKYMEDNFNYKYSITTVGAYLGVEAGAHWVYLSEVADIGHIVHECIHLVAGICREQGLNCSLTKENDEWLAGYITYWVERVAECFKK